MAAGSSVPACALPAPPHPPCVSPACHRATRTHTLHAPVMLPGKTRTPRACPPARPPSPLQITRALHSAEDQQRRHMPQLYLALVLVGQGRGRGGAPRLAGRGGTGCMASSRQVRAASQPALQTAARLRPPLIPPPPSPFSRVAAHQDGHGLLGERAARLAGHAILACLEHCPQLRRRQLGGGLGEGRLLGGGAWSMLSARAAPGSAVQCPAPEHAISLVRPAQLCLPLPFSWGQPCTTTTSTATLLQR